MADITGTNGRDTLFGTGFDDSISALDGDDFVNAGAGNDGLGQFRRQTAVMMIRAGLR
jgi:hypothetical protein